MMKHFWRQGGAIRMSAQATAAFELLGQLRLSIPDFAAFVEIIDAMLDQGDEYSLSDRCFAGASFARDAALILVMAMGSNPLLTADIKRRLLSENQPLGLQIFSLFPVLAEASLLADSASAGLDDLRRRR